MSDIDLIIKARNFAISNHQRVNQLYGGLPYHIHLLEVVEFANKFGYLLKEDDIPFVIAAAWNHDVVEDTGLTYNNVKNTLGEKVANLVVNLTTNIYGKNREERADKAYYDRVISDELSLFIKLADRMANMYHSFTYGSSMYEKYKKEYPHFKEMLYNGMYQEMWDFLDDIENFKPGNKEYYPSVEKFDEESVYQIHLPKPIPYTMFKELYSKGIIPKKDLRKNTYYRGKCRNGSVALWNGFEFVYMRYKFGFYIDTINHLEDDNGYDLFVPFQIEDNPKEEQRIKY